jgi:hypothetical protein
MVVYVEGSLRLLGIDRTRHAAGFGETRHLGDPDYVVSGGIRPSILADRVSFLTDYDQTGNSALTLHSVGATFISVAKNDDPLSGLSRTSQPHSSWLDQRLQS